ARGIVTVTRELDYEVTQAYQLTVNATDQDKTRPLSTLANLAIIITDVQDMDPIFINLPYSTNIYEHSPPGTTVRVITAVDQDKGRPRGIGYTIVSGNTNSIFALDYISGALTLNGLLDRENPLYSHGFILTVKVVDKDENPEGLRSGQKTASKAKSLLPKRNTVRKGKAISYNREAKIPESLIFCITPPGHWPGTANDQQRAKEESTVSP
ncbi:hypothetical protein A6R68_09242, partial [Neotoma lepida]